MYIFATILNDLKNRAGRVFPVSFWIRCLYFFLVATWPVTRAFAEAPIINLSFTENDRINTENFNTYDRKQPFYFSLTAAQAGARLPDSYPFTVDAGTEFAVWLDREVPDRVHSQAGRSLAIKITSKQEANVKDKIFFSPVPHNSGQRIDISEANTRRFIGFDVMLAPDYETPAFWAIHLQAWQCCGGRPPFVMSVAPTINKKGPVELVFAVRDDHSEGEAGRAETVLFRQKIRRGLWHNIVLQLEPRSDEDSRLGTAAMWLNGVQRFYYRGHWGYDVDKKGLDGKPRSKSIGVDIGVYRRRQTTTQTIYFDNIIYGKSFDSVTSEGKRRSQ